MSAKGDEMKVEYVKLDSLCPAAYNPPTRTEPLPLAELLASIKEIGLKMPIMIDDRNNIIDGHRRYACAKLLGWARIPVIRVDRPDPALYSQLIDTTLRPTGKQAVFTYIHGGPVTKEHERRLKNIVAAGGPELLERVFSLNLAPGLWSEAARAASYCGLDWKHNKKLVRPILEYMIEGRRQQSVRQAINSGIPASILWDAIQAGRELKAEYR